MAGSLIGKTIGKYQIVELLGRGGMAEVYKAYQPSLDRYVAIKLMHSFLADDADFLGRFQREAKAVASLRHSNIVQVHDFDVADGIYYMVMEFIDGVTLKAKLQELASNNTMMPLDEATRITKDVASALAYAHRRDMVHRDVKPANVMLDREGRIILTDFGIAKILSGPQYTASGAMVGTPAYMSPEQGLGQPGDARSDIYALGTMLFQMATGQLPYDADTPLAIVLKHVNDPLPIPSRLNPELPADVERVIFKSMAKNPDDRYQTAGEFIAHLEQIQQGQAIPEGAQETAFRTRIATGRDATIMHTPPPPPITHTPTPPPIQVPTTASKTRKPWVWVAAGVGALMLIAITAGAALGLTGLLKSATPTPTEAIAAATAAPRPTAPAATPTNTPFPATLSPAHITATAAAGLAQMATSMAQIAATQTADAPTQTPTVTLNPTTSPTPTPGCDYASELVAFYVYDNPRTYDATRNQTSITTSTQFPFTVELTNSGTCPWPAGTQLVHTAGDALGASEVIATEAETAVDDTAEFTTPMRSGTVAGLVTSTWELQLPDGTLVGEPLEVRIAVYRPATPTPTKPPVPTATPTASTAGPIDFNFFIHDCEYVGDDWRCWMTLTPYGGIGQPYTFFIFDSAQPTRYYGGNQEHLLQSRRCFMWIHEIKLQDDGGNSITKNIAVDPNAYFPGGCTQP